MFYRSLFCRWPDIGVPIEVVRGEKNSLNNRSFGFYGDKISPWL
jgi:hypothetical protein